MTTTCPLSLPKRAGSQWLADRFEQHRPRPRAVAYRMLGNEGRNIEYGEVVRWFQGRVSIAGHPAAAHSGVSTLRAPWQDRLS
jgi:hypothetical protein